jgi:hypothetical protein
MIDTFLRHNQEKYLAEFARRLPSGYTRTDAGEVAVFHPLAMNTNNPSILVSAGWHGDEEGATLALMDFVSNEDSKFHIFPSPLPPQIIWVLAVTKREKIPTQGILQTNTS